MSRNESTLKPDGPGWRARIGVPHTMTARYLNQNCGPWLPMVCHSTHPAFSLLISPHSLILPVPKTRRSCLRDCRCRRSFMPGRWAVLLGTLPGEQELVSRVEQQSNGIPVLMSARCPARTLEANESQSILLGSLTTSTRKEFHILSRAWIRGRSREPYDAPIEVPHPNTGSAASPARIYEWVRSHVPPSAQAVFIGGNALRAIGVIAALEDDLRLPVLTANQVSLWYALRVAGAEVSVDDYGQLFKLPCGQSEIH